MPSAMMRTISQGPAHFSLWPWMKGMRIHTHLSEHHFDHIPLTWEFLLALTFKCYGLCVLQATFPLLSLCDCKGLFLHLILTQCPLRVSSKRSAFRLPWEQATKPSFDLAESAASHFSVVPLQIHDTVIQMTRILGGSGGTEVLICRTWILTTVESPFKRVSLKPIVIFFFPSQREKKKQFTLLAAIFCLLYAIMGDLVFAPSQIGSFSTPAGACWEVIYIQGEEAAIGSAALKAVV